MLLMGKVMSIKEKSKYFNQYRDSKTNQDLNQYDFIHCNVQNNQQQFNIKPIKTLDDYNSTVKSGIDR